MREMNSHADSEKMIFRQTDRHIGRRVYVNPGNSPMRHLEYGRIILDQSKSSDSFTTGDRETGLICLTGRATVAVDGNVMSLEPYDSVYVPRDSSVEVKTDSNVDIAEFSAEVGKRYAIKMVRFSELEKQTSLRFSTGGPGCMREVNTLLGKNVEAGRLLIGYTISEPGNWTSWPPHEHAAMLEEIYVYFKMPAPAFAIQLVYGNTEDPELVTVVREGDAVLMPSGFHPNVAVPGHRICFLWAMAAHREVEDRQYGVVNVQQGFEQQGLNLRPGSTSQQKT
jgi:5-deoxy-glucuronate isomerase